MTKKRLPLSSPFLRLFSISYFLFHTRESHPIGVKPPNMGRLCPISKSECSRRRRSGSGMLEW
jgi:hypothetical protein